MISLLSLLIIGPLVVLVVAVARRGRSPANERAALVATMGNRYSTDVVSYTEACSGAACLVLANGGMAEPGLRSIVRDAVVQIDTVLRAARWRALAGAPRAVAGAFGAWGECLVWAARIADPDIVVDLLSWRGRERGVADLRKMTEIAVARFTEATGDNDSPLIAAFADVLVRQGLLRPEDLEPPARAGIVPDGAE